MALSVPKPFRLPSSYSTRYVNAAPIGGTVASSEPIVEVAASPATRHSIAGLPDSVPLSAGGPSRPRMTL